MAKEARNRPLERRTLLSLLFGGAYPREKKKRRPLESDPLLPRLLRFGGYEAIANLKKERLVEISADDSGTFDLWLSEEGFLRVLDDAKAILKVRFLLGLHPIPCGEAVELTTD